MTSLSLGNLGGTAPIDAPGLPGQMSLEQVQQLLAQKRAQSAQSRLPQIFQGGSSFGEPAQAAGGEPGAGSGFGRGQSGRGQEESPFKRLFGQGGGLDNLGGRLGGMDPSGGSGLQQFLSMLLSGGNGAQSGPYTVDPNETWDTSSMGPTVSNFGMLEDWRGMGDFSTAGEVWT